MNSWLLHIHLSECMISCLNCLSVGLFCQLQRTVSHLQSGRACDCTSCRNGTASLLMHCAVCSKMWSNGRNGLGKYEGAMNQYARFHCKQCAKENAAGCGRLPLCMPCAKMYLFQTHTCKKGHQLGITERSIAQRSGPRFVKHVSWLSHSNSGGRSAL